jgi:hypothetical protein
MTHSHLETLKIYGCHYATLPPMSYKGKNFCFGSDGISEFSGFVSLLFLNFRYLESPFGAGRNSVVGMATRIRTGRRGVRTPVGARDFIFSKLLPGRLFGPPSVLYNGYPSFFPVVKRPGRRVDHSPPFSAVVKNEWDIILLCAFTRVRWRLLPLTVTCSVCHCLTEEPMEMQKENYPSAQIYLKFEIVLVEIESSLSMDPACSSKGPCISTSNCTLLQLIRMQYRSLVLTNK